MSREREGNEIIIRKWTVAKLSQILSSIHICLWTSVRGVYPAAENDKKSIAFVTRAPNIVVPLEFIDPTKKFRQHAYTVQPHMSTHTHTHTRTHFKGGKKRDSRAKRKGDSRKRETNTHIEWISLYIDDLPLWQMFWNSKIFDANQSAWNPIYTREKGRETRRLTTRK